MTKKDIDNIISIICPNDEDFEKPIISPAYLKKELEALALEQEPCDAISRQAAIDAMYALCDTGETLRENPWRDNPHIDAITDALDNLPSVTPQQKIGRWILSGGYWRCSECKEKALLKLDKSMGGCKEYMPIKSKYCYNCGAKMQEE